MARPSDASLLGLEINPGVLTPSFISSTLAYTAAVDHVVASTNITATASPGDAISITVTPSGGSAVACTGAGGMPAARRRQRHRGHRDGARQRGGPTPSPSRGHRLPDDALIALEISSGTLTPAFASETMAYAATVPQCRRQPRRDADGQRGERHHHRERRAGYVRHWIGAAAVDRGRQSHHDDGDGAGRRDRARLHPRRDTAGDQRAGNQRCGRRLPGRQRRGRAAGERRRPGGASVSPSSASGSRGTARSSSPAGADGHLHARPGLQRRRLVHLCGAGRQRQPERRHRGGHRRRTGQTGEAPQIGLVDNQNGSTLPFTDHGFENVIQLPAGSYTGTMGPKDIFFLVYTVILTPTGDVNQPPHALRFGNIVFDLSAFFNYNLLPGYRFRRRSR